VHAVGMVTSDGLRLARSRPRISLGLSTQCE
jgi:hypothetical protein